jgi:lycopene cyclase CruA
LDDLNQINALSKATLPITWLFSKGMMVPTGKYLPLNVLTHDAKYFFFETLADEPQTVSDPSSRSS